MVRLRNVQQALKQRVFTELLNNKKRPRHIDNGLLAISYIFREKDDHTRRWLNVQQLEDTLREVFYAHTGNSLGALFSRQFTKAIPLLVDADILEYNNHDKTSFRVTEVMTRIMLDAANKIALFNFNKDSDPDADIKARVKQHYAHCDYIRLKIGIYVPSIRFQNKELRLQLTNKKQEVWGLKEKMRKYKERFLISDDDETMAVDRLPIPASVLLTPTSASRSCLQNSAAAYPTPESLPYGRHMSALHPSGYPSPGYPSTPSPSLCSPLRYHTPLSVDADGDDDLVDSEDFPAIVPSVFPTALSRSLEHNTSNFPTQLEEQRAMQSNEFDSTLHEQQSTEIDGRLDYLGYMMGNLRLANAIVIAQTSLLRDELRQVKAECDHAREECKRLLEELAIEKQLLGVATPSLQAAYVAFQEIERIRMAREDGGAFQKI